MLPQKHIRRSSPVHMTTATLVTHAQFYRLCTPWPNSTSFLGAIKLLVLLGMRWSRCLLPAQSCHATVTQSSLGFNPLTPHRPLGCRRPPLPPLPSTHTSPSASVYSPLFFPGCVVISAPALSLASPPATAAASRASRHSSEGHRSGQLSPGTHHLRAVPRPCAARPPRDPTSHPSHHHPTPPATISSNVTQPRS